MKTSGRAVLVVDDGDSDRNLFQIAAADAKWVNRVLEFEDGEEVVQYLERSGGEMPALLVLDLKMPRMDGFQVLRWLRIRREWDHVPTVILTSSNLEADRLRGMSLGPTEYYVKPSTYSELVNLAVELRRRWLDRQWPQGVSPAAQTKPSSRTRRVK